MTLREKVEAGIAVLDQKYPQWLKMIDTDVLRMEHSSYCIVGQISSYTGEGWTDVADRINFGDLESLGMDLSIEQESSSRWRELTDLWREAIWFGE